jgi:hypothetical protein
MQHRYFAPKRIGTYGVVNVGDGDVYARGTSPGIVTASIVNFDNAAFTTGGPTLKIELAVPRQVRNTINFM